MKFPLGFIVATTGALDALVKANQSSSVFLDRHRVGDWGDLDTEDMKANEDAVVNGGRLLSVYKTTDGEVVWVITEADRSATTLLLPNEY